MLEAASAGADKALGIMDAQLAKSPFSPGTFTLADVCFMPYFEYAMGSPAKGSSRSTPT